jgi:hypothetical protein
MRGQLPQTPIDRLVLIQEMDFATAQIPSRGFRVTDVTAF